MAGFAFFLVPTVILLIIIRKYRESKWGKCKNNVKLKGKVAIVTGANSGIGFETAKEFAIRGASVILACRNLDSAKIAADRIKSVSGSNQLFPMPLDLGSIASIVKFVDDVKENFTYIHLLVNNAGISLPKKVRQETEDGFETHFGVNHLGHFLLTNLLLDVLKRSKPSRIIIVASVLHEKAQLNLDDLNARNARDEKLSLYASSKLANMYFARELAKRLKGSGVNVYALCPGWVYTGLFRYHGIKWYHYLAFGPVAFLFMRSPKQGAQTVIYCATEPSLDEETGYLYRECRKYTSKHNFDPKIAVKLWDESVRMLEEKGIKIKEV